MASSRVHVIFRLCFCERRAGHSCDSHFTTPLCSWDASLDGIGLHRASNEDNEPSKLKHLVCWIWGSSRWGDLPSCATPPKLTGHQRGVHQPAHPCMRNLGELLHHHCQLSQHRGVAMSGHTNKQTQGQQPTVCWWQASQCDPFWVSWVGQFFVVCTQWMGCI